MAYEKLTLPEVMLFTPRVFGDERGFFFESFNEREFLEATGLSNCHFVQDNHSRSVKGVLRGLHYQLPPHAQGKLVRVVQGAVFDVAVDIRKSSPNFGKWAGVLLDADKKQQLWIPPGFAHGFVTLSDTAEFLYKTTDFYAPQFERCIAWSEPEIAVDWHSTETPQLSAKDLQGLPLAKADVFE
jgi:dTDP-4-dehydrorhamnose 3,5-epimerase